MCWGCDRYCPVDDMVCGNGSVATLHPAELFGNAWANWLPVGETMGLSRLTLESLTSSYHHSDDHAIDGSGPYA
ncbi:MAG: DUF3079 domain-containing protein [Rubrivivax sp.]